MAISDIPLFSALKSRMAWLQARQTVLAENVANADTPGYRARDIEEFVLPLDVRVPAPDAVAPMRTDKAHIALAFDVQVPWGREKTSTFEVTPSRNTVVLEEEMMKVGENQLDYQLATGLYGRGIGILKTALGRRA